MFRENDKLVQFLSGHDFFHNTEVMMDFMVQLTASQAKHSEIGFGKFVDLS